MSEKKYMSLNLNGILKPKMCTCSAREGIYKMKNYDFKYKNKGGGFYYNLATGATQIIARRACELLFIFIYNL